MIRREFSDDALFFDHTAPLIVRAMGVVLGLVNGLMLLSGLLFLFAGQLFGLGFVVLGGLGVTLALAMNFGRHTQRLDRETIVQTWSLLVPIKRRVVRVADIDALVVTRSYRRVKYSVVIVDQLIAVGPTTTCALISSGVPEFASDVETIARLLAKPIRDERNLDTRALVRGTQLKALPIALAILSVIFCMIGIVVFTLLAIQHGPSGEFRP